MSIKPTRTELLDMIIDRVQDEIVKVSQDWRARSRKVESEINQMVEERNQKRYNKQKAEKQLTAVQNEIDAVLAKHGFSSANTTLSFTTSDDGLRITPVLRFAYSSTGRTVEAKPTKVLDRKIDAKRQELDDLKAEASKLRDKWGRALCENTRTDRYMRPEEKRELRTEVVRLLCKSDPEMIKQIDTAAKAIAVNDAEEMATKLFG